MKNYSTLFIENIIIHEIIKQKSSVEKLPPNYSDIESELEEEIRVFLKTRMIDAVGSAKAQSIVFDELTESPVPELIKSLLLNDYDGTSFVSISKKIADYLNQIQTGKNSGGYLTLINGTNMNRKIIGVLKIEAEEGARLEQSERDGKKTFEITQIKNLILSKYTRLLKVGVFYQNGNEIEGKICDNQLTGVGDVATFFLKFFLGCKFTVDPSIQTKEFFEGSIKFIQKKINDPRTQSKYMLHLQSYILNQETNINPRFFSNRYLETKHRQAYENFLIEEGLEIRDIIKDTASIKSQVEKSVLKFKNGIQIIGSRQEFEDSVKIKYLKDGDTKAIVKSRLEKI